MLADRKNRCNIIAAATTLWRSNLSMRYFHYNLRISGSSIASLVIVVTMLGRLGFSSFCDAYFLSRW